VITRTFTQTNWFNFTWRNATKSSPRNFTQYAVLPHNMEIVMWPHITVTSLHPMYRTKRDQRRRRVRRCWVRDADRQACDIELRRISAAIGRTMENAGRQARLGRAAGWEGPPAAEAAVKPASSTELRVLITADPGRSTPASDDPLERYKMNSASETSAASILLGPTYSDKSIINEATRIARPRGHFSRANSYYLLDFLMITINYICVRPRASG